MGARKWPEHPPIALRLALDHLTVLSTTVHEMSPNFTLNERRYCTIEDLEKHVKEKRKKQGISCNERETVRCCSRHAS